VSKIDPKVDGLVNEFLSGRVSRRALITRAAAAGLSVPVIAALSKVDLAGAQATPGAGGGATGKVEIFSWWTSGGEAAGLQKLFDIFKAQNPGVDIVNATVAGGGGNNAQAVLQSRLSANNPPDAWQTHLGHELYDQYVDPGYTADISSLYASEGWSKVMPQGIIDQITEKGKQYAIPVGVHRGNGLWYNKKVLSDNGITIGDTLSMDDLVKALDTLKGKGITGFGLGDKDTFVDAQTFENTLIGAIGPENYMKLFTGDLKWDDQSVKDAMTAFGKLLDYVNPDHSGLTWDGATGELMDGKVAFNTMGDWAYGEFVKKNVVDQMGWVSFPGTDKTFVLVVDCFATSVKSPNPDGAIAWMKVLGSKDGQEEFNPLKGSIPARTDVDKSKFSAYHQWSMANFASATLVPSTAHGEAAPPAFKQSFIDAAIAFVTAKDVDAFSQALVDAANS
jgi:glucose/mannose transport system substrate-binding protein